MFSFVKDLYIRKKFILLHLEMHFLYDMPNLHYNCDNTMPWTGRNWSTSTSYLVGQNSRFVHHSDYSCIHEKHNMGLICFHKSDSNKKSDSFD